ncbi:hypothetical protein GW796_07170 [archaeon]|nr:hypothetical protein [archaeon]NCQ51663.1 hypothetical protein [archaeon]
MNEKDRDNLAFLLGASPTVLKDWYEQMSADDHKYAKELLDSFQKEIDEKILDEKVSEELSKMETFPDITKMLNKFML